MKKRIFQLLEKMLFLGIDLIFFLRIDLAMDLGLLLSAVSGLSVKWIRRKQEDDLGPMLIVTPAIASKVT